MSIASLKLFGEVPESSKEHNDKCEFISEYGVVILPSAMHERDKIHQFLYQERLNGNQLNSSFHKSWSKVKNASEIQLRIEQLLHYMSTYGFSAIGVYSDQTIYIPGEKLDLPEQLPLKVIGGVSKKDLIYRCFKLLSGVALEQETVQNAVNVLEECGYTFTGDEDIKNKEAACLIYDKTGTLPEDGDELLRYFVYKSTGSTLVIKNRESFELIDRSRYKLPNLTDRQLKNLAASFNRHKPLWLSFKKAHRDNKRVVNKIAKLSKIYHKPLPVSVLGNLTNTDFTDEKVTKHAQRANSFQLVKSINALRLYRHNERDRFYKIRNGKGWVQEKQSQLNKKQMEDHEKILLEELKKRLPNKKVYWPEHVSYSLPTSEKQFVGNVPSGTKIKLPETQEHLLMGIYWEGRVDLDLRADALLGSVGWNSNYRTKSRGLMFSGDVTSAPNGATEWMYCRQVDDTYLLKINLFHGPINHPYKIILGYGSDIKTNYMIDPNKVIFQGDAQMAQKEILMGIVDRELNFYVVGQGSGGRNVGSFGPRSMTLQQNLVDQNKYMLRLDELFTPTNKDNSDVSLDPQDVNKDTLLNLLE